LKNVKIEKVEIEWVDSKGVTPSWEYKNELEPLTPVLVSSVGYLLEDNKDYKTLAQSVSAEQVLGRIAISAASIKKLRIIK